MPREDQLITEGTVIKVMPSSLYKVKLNNGHELLCHLSGKMKMNSITLTTGDKVELELSPYDLSKGRITYRLK